MALIPITFQADLGDENAKGNMRPEDMAALFAFLYPQEAGILNITGQDCSQWGAINIVGSTAQVTFHKGYIVVQGRAIYIEEGTQVAFNLATTSQTTSGVLGVRINLAASGANEVSWFQEASVRTNDLLANPSSGVYEFILYNYKATNTNFELGAKTTQIINNLDDYIKNGDYITQPKGDNSKKIATTEFVKNSCGVLKISGPFQIKASNRGNANEYAIIEYNFEGTGTYVLNENGKFVWQGNLFSKQTPRVISASSNDPNEVGYVGSAGLDDYKITKVNGKTVSEISPYIVSLGVLFHNVETEADNFGRSILQGGDPASKSYFALDDGFAFRLKKENRVMINNIILEFQI